MWDEFKVNPEKQINECILDVVNVFILLREFRIEKCKELTGTYRFLPPSHGYKWVAFGMSERICTLWGLGGRTDVIHIR
jgi:hypothetical protein